MHPSSMLRFELIKISPVASGNPTGQSEGLRRTRERFWAQLGAETRRGNGHGNPLNGPHNTSDILTSHGSHIVSKVVLKGELKCNSQNWSKIVTVPISFTGWTYSTRSHLECRGQIKSSIRRRPILNRKEKISQKSRRKKLLCKKHKQRNCFNYYYDFKKTKTNTNSDHWRFFL